MSTSRQANLQPRNLKSLLAWKALAVVIAFAFLALSVPFWLSILYRLPPDFFKMLAGLLPFGALLVSSLFPHSRILHEGLHVIAALWLDIPGKDLRAKGVHVYIRRAPKREWILVTLCPIILPVFALLILGPFDMNWAFVYFFAIMVGSSKDLASVLFVLLEPGQFVQNTSNGLSVTAA